MKILFVDLGSNSKTFLETIEPVIKAAKCYFLEHLSSIKGYEPMLDGLGTLILWEQYHDAINLLKTVEPDKIVFTLLEDYYQIALYFAAKHLSVPIHYIDHGIRFEHEVDIMNEIEKSQLGLLQRVITKNTLTAWLSFWKNKFYRGTRNHLDRDDKKLALHMFFSRCLNYYGSFMKKYGRNLLPDNLIIYSVETLSFYKRFFSIPNSWHNQTFIGIPSLDKFHSICQYMPGVDAKHVLFIDQPMHEQKLAGWTRSNKQHFIRRMLDVIKGFHLHLYLKPHPLNENYYGDIVSEYDNFSIIDNLTLDVCKKIKFVGSFNSTLLLPFCTVEGLEAFCIELHPISITPNISLGITKYGVAIPIYSYGDLEKLFQNKPEISKKNKNIKHKYSNEMLHIFDGKATARLNAALLM